MLDLFYAAEGFDFWFTQLAQSWENVLLTQAMLAITFLGNPLFWMLIVAAAYWMGKEKDAFYLAAITLFSAVSVGALKLFFARPRPSTELFKRLTYDFYDSLSFPSGHAALIASYWGYLSSRLKKMQSALLFILVLLVGFSRIYLGAHFVSDVIAGILLGIVVGKITYYLKEEVELLHFKPTKLMDSLAIAAIVAVFLLALLFLENVPLAASLMGFFAGYFLCQEMGFCAPQLKGRQLLIKEMFGFIVLGLAWIAMPFLAGIQLPFGLGGQGYTRTFILYAFIGFWVSFLWPVGHQKILKRLQAKSK